MSKTAMIIRFVGRYKVCLTCTKHIRSDSIHISHVPKPRAKFLFVLIFEYYSLESYDRIILKICQNYRLSAAQQ